MTSPVSERNGTDSHNFVTYSLCPYMVGFSKKLHEVLLTNQEELNLSTVDFSEPFNHYTVLIYYADQENDRKSSMGLHSDCMYKTKCGSFYYARNSEEVNTPTVVLSLGDTRTLKWKRRHLLPKLQDSKCLFTFVVIPHYSFSHSNYFIVAFCDS